MVPGDSKPKRVVDVHELAEMLTLASKVSWNAYWPHLFFLGQHKIATY